MSTNCTIGYINKRGEYENIYCHYDGGIGYTGHTLFHYYKNFKDVEALIKLGNLKFLHKNIEKVEIDLDPFIQIQEPNKEYNYLFKNGEWFVLINNFENGKWVSKKRWKKLHFDNDLNKEFYIKKIKKLNNDFGYSI